MSGHLVDLSALQRFLTNVKALLSGKANKNLSDVSESDFASKMVASHAQMIYDATSSDGVSYTATIPGITSLYAGLTIIVKLSRTSSSTSPKLNLNGIGDKGIRQPLTTNNVTATTGPLPTWLNASCPIVLTYNGSLWVTNYPITSGAYLYGTVPVTKGGTGANNATDALTNLGAASLSYVQSEIARLESLISGNSSNS